MKKKILLVVTVLILVQMACLGGGEGWNGEESNCARAAAAAGYGDFETRVVGGICQVNAGDVPGRSIWIDLEYMPRRQQ